MNDRRSTSADNQYIKMTRTPIPKLVTSLSIPTIFSMLVTSFYNMVDTAFVGKLGNSASGAVGVVFGFMAILQAVGFMFGQGAGSIISRKLGVKDAGTSSVIASTGFFGALLIGGLFGVLGFLFQDELVMALGSTDTIAPYARAYLKYILMASPFMMSSLVLNNILRYEGKAVLGMVGLVLGGVLNIAGDAFFIFALEMGVGGAGLATGLSQMVSFFILLSMFLRGKTQCRLSVRLITGDLRQLLDIMATGSPSLLRQGLSSYATVLLNSLAKPYGDGAIAAMSIVSRITMFVFSVIIGIGQGYQPVSGFNYGAGKYSRVRQGFRFTLILSQTVMTIAATVVLLLSTEMIQIFRDDPQVIEIGTRALQLQCVALYFLPFAMVTEMQLQSTGQRLGAALLSSGRNGLFFIPTLVILAHVRGLAGIQEAQPLAFVLSFFFCIFFAVWFFRKLPKEDLPDAV